MMIMRGRGEKRARRAHDEHGSSRGASRLPGPFQRGQGCSCPSLCCWLSACPPCFCLPWWLLAFVIVISIFFSHDSRVDDYLMGMSPAPGLCGAPWLRALRDVGSPQSKRNRKLTAVFPVILGHFRWIHEDRYSPRSAVLVPVLLAHTRSFSQLLGQEPTGGMSWAAPAPCPRPGPHGAALSPFLLTHLLMSSPLVRASWGFLITGSGALPAPCSGRMREEVWPPPISRNTSVTTCPNRSVLFPRHPARCLWHGYFAYHLSNPRDCKQKQTSWGTELQLMKSGG